MPAEFGARREERRVLSPQEILNRFKQEKDRAADPSDEWPLEALKGSLRQSLFDATTANETLQLLDQGVKDGILSSHEREEVLKNAVKLHLEYYRQFIDQNRNPLEYFKTVYPNTPELAELLIREFEKNIDKQIERLQEELAQLQRIKQELQGT